jgi:hypothetical protein
MFDALCLGCGRVEISPPPLEPTEMSRYAAASRFGMSKYGLIDSKTPRWLRGF